MKTLLVIGSGWEQYALIKEAKKLGHKIITTHPVMNTDGFSLADATFVKDSRDIEACQEKQIQQPIYFQVETLKQIQEAGNNIGFPLIVKPIDSRGTFGVTIVHQPDKLEDAFYDAIMNSPSRRVICEQFITGTLVTVDGFCFKNGHQSLTVASRVFEKGEKPVTKEIIYPAQFDNTLNERLMENHHQVVQALDYRYGHTHGEYLVTVDQEIYLVECTNRGGGVYTSSTIVPLLTKINLNEILINQSLGQDSIEMENMGLNFMTKSVILTFLDFEVGKVVKNINLSEVKKLPYVVKYRTIYTENDMVESIEDCAARHSMLVLQGSNTEVVTNNLKDFKSKLRIEYHNL